VVRQVALRVGTFERLNAALRERVRSPLGRNPLPSAGIADSQSTKTSGVGGQQRGYDANKKVRGSKRHLLVDTEGLVLKAKVHSAAKVPEHDGLRYAAGVGAHRAFAPQAPVAGRRIRGQGQAVGRGGDGLECGGGAQAAQARAGGGGEAMGRGMGKGGQEDRLAKADAAARIGGSTSQVGGGAHLFLALSQQEDEPMDYERLCASAEAFIYAAMIRLMVRRLARA
jgi:hypothetical protein